MHIFNYIFIFRLGWGVAGAAWASNVAQAVGFAMAFALFLRVPFRESHKSHLSWRPRMRRIREQLGLGLPMGMMPAADILGFSVFQMMQVRYGTVAGAATQMVSVLTSIAYMPGIGIATAATTLVGQSIGAGDRNWAMRLGTRVILLAALVMGGIGVAIAIAGPWLMPLFAGSHDSNAAAAATLGMQTALAGRGLSVLRRPESRQQHVSARRRGRQSAGRAGLPGLLARVPAAGAHPHLRARPGLVSLPAAVGLWRPRAAGPRC